MASFPLFINPVQHRGMLSLADVAVTITLITAVYGLALRAFSDGGGARTHARQRLARAASAVRHVPPRH